MTDKMIRMGFILAGLSNILGVAICSKFLTNDVLKDTQPAVMGGFGLIAIMLWGLAYISVANRYETLKWLIAVFAIEKLAYVAAWVSFMSSQSLEGVYNQDFLAGVFFTIYGVNDFVFMLFFVYVFARKTKS